MTDKVMTVRVESFKTDPKYTMFYGTITAGPQDGAKVSFKCGRPRADTLAHHVRNWQNQMGPAVLAELPDDGRYEGVDTHYLGPLDAGGAAYEHPDPK